MEKALNKALEDIMNADGVNGVVMSDSNGLCLGAKGVGTEQSSGAWVAMMKEACKLEPDLPPPTLVLDSPRKHRIIQRNDKLILTVFKDRG